MNKFLTAIENGVSKKSESRKAHAEIQRVLDEVSSAIGEFTRGRLALRRIVLSEALARNYFNAHSSYHSLSSLKKKYSFTLLPSQYEQLPEKKEHPNALVLVHPKQRQAKLAVFAKWDEDPLGFPCVVTSYYGYEYVCSTADELSNAFMQMLKHPEFGSLLNTALVSNDKKLPGGYGSFISFEL